MSPDELLYQILSNESYYNQGDERQFVFDLSECFKLLLDGYTPAVNLNNLTDIEYNRMGYMLFIATVFFAKKNNNKELIEIYKKMEPKKVSGCFFYLEKVPAINHDELACKWNLKNSCHPIELKKYLNFP